MYEISGSLLRRGVVLAVVITLVAATLALVTGGTASAASVGSVAVGTSKLGACKKKAVASCRKVTARACRAKTTKRLRAQDRRVSKRTIARNCAKKAKRHCNKKAQKRKQASAATRCARPSKTSPRPAPPRSRPAGVPGSTNTGVPAGTRLKIHRGDLTITRAGTVVDGLDIRGFVVVKSTAHNVIIRNSIIRGGQTGTTNRSIVAAHGGQTGLRIYDTTIKGAYPNPYLDGLKGNNFTADRLDISNVVDTALIFGDNATIRSSWLHGNTHFSPDPRTPDNKSHDDNVQIEGGRNINILDNRLEGADNTAIMVTQNWGRTAEVTVSGNHLADGSCTVNMDEKKKGPVLDFTIESNTFGLSRYHGNRCPMRIPSTSDVRTVSNRFVTNATASPNRY